MKIDKFRIFNKFLTIVINRFIELSVKTKVNILNKNEKLHNKTTKMGNELIDSKREINKCDAIAIGLKTFLSEIDEC